ncbi:hypothetical protein PFISCL1PPCAC_13764, partial [Pristionchus fissidentatus]
KEFSLLLLNAAICELASLFLHFLFDGRLFLATPAVFSISNGPCQLVSDDFCAVVGAFLHVNMFHSTSIIAASFWYRVRILRNKGFLGMLKLQILLTILYVPHVLHAVGYIMSISSRAQLTSILDQFYAERYSDNYSLQGYVDIVEPVPVLMIGYLTVGCFMQYVFIVHLHNQLLRIQREKTTYMSVKTRITQESLTKALTIHVITPVIFINGIASLCFAQMTFQMHSIDIEGLTFDLAALPTLVNPMLNIYFVKPYRT